MVPVCGCVRAQSRHRQRTGMFRCSLFRQRALERLRSSFPSLDSMFTSYRFHKLPRWFWATRGWLGSTAGRLRPPVFACLYLFACGGTYAPCRTPPRQLYGYRPVSGGNLYISSLLEAPLPLPGTSRTSRESTAYSQETARPLPAQDYPGMSGHTETPAGTVPKYRPDRGSLH